MCMTIDYSVKSLNKRIMWKVFDKDFGKITSLYMSMEYPKGKLVRRSKGDSIYRNSDGTFLGTHGLHFYTSKALAKRMASYWPDSYIAKFAVDPADFMFASNDGKAMYERATRIGNYIKVAQKE